MKTLSPVVQKFVVHWGEMGTRWGVNRTVAQIHALLCMSEKPLSAEEISALLSVARSNVSNSIRELQSWRLIRTVQVLGDRRDYFESVKDVWEMFKIVIEERKRRELDPTLRAVADCLSALDKERDTSEHGRAKLKELSEFLSVISGLYDQFHGLSPESIKRLARFSAKSKALKTVLDMAG